MLVSLHALRPPDALAINGQCRAAWSKRASRAWSTGRECPRWLVFQPMR